MSNILEVLLLLGGNIFIWSSILHGLVATVILATALYLIKKLLFNKEEPAAS